MKCSAHLTVPLVRFILRRICRVDSDGLKELPWQGPVIFAMNHINFLEVPLVFTHLRPRPVYGIVKKETWKNPFLRFLARSWEAIPVDREKPSMETMRRAKEILDNGGMLCMAPEGTRSGTGFLSQGHPGIVSMAIHSNAIIIPVAHFGGQHFWQNFKSLRRTQFSIKSGRPFRILPGGPINSAKRQEITDEIMMQIAKLLPDSLHGIYKDRVFTTKYIQYTEEQ
ncbi:MAG: 1-acyl-sn-glycerol-3-phosphate acyltransferase [Spirochaetales bacterium]|nr:1-acyl-sn-glycerol-3-phosphate acyltransferase [Spirochaetales bacterium]